MCAINHEIAETYTGQGLIVHISTSVYNHWVSYRQINASDVEACGILIGRVDMDGCRIWINVATSPKSKDVRKRNFFHLKDKGHQEELDYHFQISNKTMRYLGTWHTHDENHPTPSPEDVIGWHKCVNENRELNEFSFVIVGRTTNQLYIPYHGRFIALERLNK